MEILDQATIVFAEHGYRTADVQWIADALKLSKGTIYHYFGSKKELFLATVRRGVLEMQEHIEGAKTGIEDPLAALRSAIKAHLRFFKSNPRLVELFIQERAEFRDKHTPVYFEHRDARRGPWRKVIRELIDRGRLRDVPVQRVIDVVGDVLYGTMFTNHFAGSSKSYDVQAQDILDVVFHGILSEGERQESNGSASK